MEISTFKVIECPECGKNFVPATQHRYRDEGGRLLCSWGCTNRRFKRLEAQKEAEKENAKQKMEKYMSEKNKPIVEAKKKVDQFVEEEHEMAHSASKAVLQFDMAGNFIKRHNSIRSAANSLGKGCSTLSKCLSGKYRNQSFGGFLWRYEKGFDTGNDEY